MERLYTESEAAEYLQVSVQTLRAWRKAGKGPKVVRFSPRLLRYAPWHLKEWVDRKGEGNA